jgi:hypothetical protein
VNSLRIVGHQELGVLLLFSSCCFSALSAANGESGSGPPLRCGAAVLTRRRVRSSRRR